jgi:3-oxoacyl-[acyl-carrier protein] reductase
MKLLEGKTALITGASKGIGRAIALNYAMEGANVAFTYLSSVEKGEALVAELEAYGVKAKGYRSDASDHLAAEALINSVVADFGKLDVLVNNAGITKDNLLMRMNEEMWDSVISVNLKSVFNTVKAATRTFMKQRSGSIINLTSVVGIKGNAGQANYAASKAGMLGLTRYAARELGPFGITVNAIAPAFIGDAGIFTEWSEEDKAVLKEKTIVNQLGSADDVVRAFEYLLDTPFVTGVTLDVNGGAFMI